MIISILFIVIVLILAYFSAKKLRADQGGSQATRSKRRPVSHPRLGSSPLNKNEEIIHETPRSLLHQEPKLTHKSSVFGLEEKAKELAEADIADPLFTDEIEKPLDRAVREEKEAVIHQAEKIKAASKPLDYVAIQLLAPENYPYTGYELLQALLANGMRFGHRQIFHRHETKSGQGDVLFSLASVAKPGTFDLTKMGGFSCPGLAMFMLVGEVADPLAAFDLMLETANALMDDLGGELCDERHQPLSADKIADIRQHVVRSEARVAI